MEINNSYFPYIKPSTPRLDKDSLDKVDKKKAKETAQAMEAEFLKIMLKAMKKTIPDNQEIKAPGKDIMNEFMLERFAEHMATKSPMGLSQMILDYVEKTEQKNTDKDIDG